MKKMKKIRKANKRNTKELKSIKFNIYATTPTATTTKYAQNTMKKGKYSTIQER